MTATTSATCPDCHREIASHGKHIHYCVVRFGRETHREYVGTFDGDVITRGDRQIAAQLGLDDYALRLVEDGLVDAPLAVLSSGYPCLGCGGPLPAGRGGHCDACVEWSAATGGPELEPSEPPGYPPIPGTPPEPGRALVVEA